MLIAVVAPQSQLRALIRRSLTCCLLAALLVPHRKSISEALKPPKPFPLVVPVHLAFPKSHHLGVLQSLIRDTHVKFTGAC